MPNVLLVEDDETISRLVREEMASQGHSVRVAGDGGSALRAVMQAEPDLLLLDLGLPDVDGFRVLAAVRAMSDIPIIVITARVADEDVVRALDLGADDYVTKPFSTAQLMARTRAVTRRSRPPEHVVTVERLTVDLLARRCLLDGADVRLTRKEFEILAVLAASVGVVVPIADIVAKVWPEHRADIDKTFDVHLSSLRTKLSETAREPRYLHRIRGLGLMLGRRPGNSR